MSRTACAENRPTWSEKIDKVVVTNQQQQQHQSTHESFVRSTSSALPTDRPTPDRNSRSLFLFGQHITHPTVKSCGVGSEGEKEPGTQHNAFLFLFGFVFIPSLRSPSSAEAAARVPSAAATAVVIHCASKIPIHTGTGQFSCKKTILPHFFSPSS